MEARVELLDLPSEVLLCIVAWLPIKDLKAIGETCHQLAAVSTLAMENRPVSLRISRYEKCKDNGEPSMQMVPEEVLDGCRRSYQSIAVDCLMYKTIQKFVDIMSRPPIAEWEIKQLILKVFQPEAVADFIEMCSDLINSVTSMRVTVFQTSTMHYPEKTVRLEMPNLRELYWKDKDCAHFSFDPSCHRVSVVAPRLSILYQQAYGFKPGSLTLANNGERSSSGYQTLRRLYIILTEEVTNALRGLVLTELKTFVGKVSVRSPGLQWFWESLAHRMPNVYTLELHLIDNPMSMRYFCAFDSLCELVVRDGVIHIEQGREYHFQELDKLCLKSCRIVAPEGKLHLPRLRTLCLSGNMGMGQHNNLDLIAPWLYYLYIGGNEDMGINFQDIRSVQFLHFVIKESLGTIPSTLAVDMLTSLYLDCRSSTSSNELEHILSRTPNLKVLLLLLHGTSVDSIESLPLWCPNLEHLYLTSHRGVTNFISIAALRSIFTLPNIKEIVIESFIVSDRDDKPIFIPHQLQTLVVQSLYFMMSQEAQLEVGAHPEHQSFSIKQQVKHGMMNVSCNSHRHWQPIIYKWEYDSIVWCDHTIKSNNMLVHLAE